MTDGPPAVGDTVHDPARDRVGVVMGGVGPYLQLRPLGGGQEWDANPDQVRPLTPTELLSARVSEANTRSRTTLDLGPLPERQPWSPSVQLRTAVGDSGDLVDEGGCIEQHD